MVKELCLHVGSRRNVNRKKVSRPFEQLYDNNTSTNTNGSSVSRYLRRRADGVIYYVMTSRIVQVRQAQCEHTDLSPPPALAALAHGQLAHHYTPPHDGTALALLSAPGMRFGFHTRRTVELQHRALALRLCSATFCELTRDTCLS